MCGLTKWMMTFKIGWIVQALSMLVMSPRMPAYAMLGFWVQIFSNITCLFCRVLRVMRFAKNLQQFLGITFFSLTWIDTLYIIDIDILSYYMHDSMILHDLFILFLLELTCDGFGYGSLMCSTSEVPDRLAFRLETLQVAVAWRCPCSLTAARSERQFPRVPSAVQH